MTIVSGGAYPDVALVVLCAGRDDASPRISTTKPREVERDRQQDGPLDLRITISRSRKVTRMALSASAAGLDERAPDPQVQAAFVSIQRSLCT